MWDAIYRYVPGQPHSQLQACGTGEGPVDETASRLNGFRVPSPECLPSARVLDDYEYVRVVQLPRLGVELPVDNDAQEGRLVALDDDPEVSGVSIHPFSLHETGYRPGSSVVPKWVMVFQPTFFVRRRGGGWLIDQLRTEDLRTSSVDLRIDRLGSFAARNGWGYSIDPVVDGEPLAEMVWG